MIPNAKTATIYDLRKRHERATYHETVVSHFDKLAEGYDKWQARSRFYINHVADVLSDMIPPGKKILIFGCFDSRIITQLKPSLGVVVDVSAKMIDVISRQGSPKNIHYFCSSPEAFEYPEKFDYILSLNQSDYAEDLALLVEGLQRHAHSGTKIVFSMLNPVWHPLVRLASFLGVRVPDFKRNLISKRVFATILEAKRYRVNHSFRRLLLPRGIPVIANFLNRFAARLPGLNSLCFVQYIVTQVQLPSEEEQLSCSVIIPCFNEEGNVRECVLRTPVMGKNTEVIIVDDGSKDATLQIAKGLEKEFNHVRVVTYGGNKGKGHAVKQGISAARGDVVMILDADMTVPPEELVDFFDAMACGAGEFISGTRFVYPMENQAMRVSNYFGNILFSKLVEFAIGSPVSDTLCGTKVMLRKDFVDMPLEDARWGDFDLIFHAAKLKLKSIQLPVHYKERVTGESKMKAFRAGVRFLSLVIRRWAALS